MLLSLQYLAARQAGNETFLAELKTTTQLFPGKIAEISREMEVFVGAHSFEDYVFLGQGPFHGIAQEAALKVMEMSCAYSQFFHTLEFRHGPKSIVSPKTCLTFFLSQTGKKDETEVLVEMKDLGAVTIAVCNNTDAQIAAVADLVIQLDLPVSELATLAPYIVPGQLMGFFSGLRKGLNPDEPKNLTRVVILD